MNINILRLVVGETRRLAVITGEILIDRSSRPEVFCKKGVLENVTKFTRKHL